MPNDPLSILVLGVGELGLLVLRHLASHVARVPSSTLSVLLRPATIASEDLDKQRDLAAIRALGVHFVPGDLAADATEALASTFKPFHTVVGCTGFVGGAGTQRKLARAVLDTRVARYVPWQFGETTTPEDIGALTAAILFAEPPIVNQIVYTAGDTITYRRLADVIEAVLGRKVQRVE